MRRTLFYIPDEVFGVPVFGVGLLLAVFVGAAVLFTFDKVRRRGFDGEMATSLLFYAVLAGAIIWVLPNIAEPGRGLPIRGYGLLLMLAVVAGVGTALLRARQMGVDPDLVLSVGIWMFIFGLIGARLLYLAEYYDEFHRPTLGATLAAVVNITKGGLVVFGALIGAVIAFLWRVVSQRLPALALADLIIASMVLGQGIGRLGCFMNGCCFGGLCDTPGLPAVTFPWGSPPHARQAERGELYLHGIKLPGDPKSPPVIVAIEPESAAATAGLRPGVRITRINARPDAPAEGFINVTTTGHARGVLLSIDGNPQPARLTVTTSDGQSYDLGTVTPDSLPRSQRVHPTQLYSAVNGLLVALFLWAVYPFRRRDGEVLAWAFVIFPITRFLMEWVRTDEPQSFLCWA